MNQNKSERMAQAREKLYSVVRELAGPLNRWELSDVDKAIDALISAALSPTEGPQCDCNINHPNDSHDPACQNCEHRRVKPYTAHRCVDCGEGDLL